jgi:4-hydroxythreonine-4-phosphate dehydrogenase
LRKPVVAITMGDPAGVGPEIVLKALADPAIKKSCLPLVLGDWGVLQRTGKRRDLEGLTLWQEGEQLLPLLNAARAVVCPLSGLKVSDSRPAKPTKAAGHATYRYIYVAAKLALSKVADAIATAPISKHSLIDSGHNYPGHTELLAELGGTPECRMMLIGDKLRVVPVTGHVAMSKVPSALTRAGIRSTLELTQRCLRDFFAIRKPRIAVAALNPHAGERGIFGNEEIDIIGPAIQSVKQTNMQVDGPLPADSLFHHAARGRYDAVVCMYHDQGLIPLKLHHFFGGVALTLGPPFIRTSVDHGTAYDIAGKNKADATSMKEAILLAARLARLRNERGRQ